MMILKIAVFTSLFHSTYRAHAAVNFERTPLKQNRLTGIVFRVHPGFIGYTGIDDGYDNIRIPARGEEFEF